VLEETQGSYLDKPRAMHSCQKRLFHASCSVFVQAGDFLQCVNEQAGADITRNLPADSDVPPAVNPILEQKARNSSVNTGINEINYEKVPRARLDFVSFRKFRRREVLRNFAFFCSSLLNIKKYDRPRVLS
jgi:hypothetical protein